MPFTANNNGAAPLAQPPVCTLAVPEYLRPRIEAAHKRIEEEHPGAMSHQAVLNALIVCGLEAIEFQYLTHGTGSTATALQTMAAPSTFDGWPWLMTRIIRPYEKSVSISDLGG